ncbi:TIM-barrel domain-containing protein [Haliscomenobacter hydrossis]|nr:TIM-barrel domain-containing protein [Haliscomenobacter hydrossis]
MQPFRTFTLFLFIICQFSAVAQTKLLWQELYPGIWKAAAGKPEKISLLSTAGAKPQLQALAKLPKTTFPLDKAAIDLKVIDHKIYLRFPLDEEEQLFGLGLNFQTVNQRGRIMELHVDHYGGEDNGRTHAPVPFYVSSKGYGVLIDAARYITVYAGTGVRTNAAHPPVVYDRNTDKQWDAQPYSDAVEILVPAEGANIYIFAGPTPMQVVQRYNLMNGGGYLPPKWGLGFTQRVPTLYSQDDILKEATSFEAHNFPLDFIGVEPGWHSSSYPCTFEWDKTRFPDPKGFLEALAKKGLSANLWFNPYVSPKASLYPKIKPLSGSHTVWNGIVSDFTLPQTRALFKDHFMKTHLEIGVGGYKVDEVDGYDFWVWPDVATFPSGTSAEQMRQVYGNMVQNMTGSWFKAINKRTYGLVRASNAGSSNFPYVIYNDYYSHKDFITALVNSSFIGVLWTPEVRASKSAEEWVRRMQSVCFSPMAMLNAWADGTKPWSFPEVEQAVNEVASLRMQLLPYLYSTFAQYHFEGKPPFRAMNLVEGFGYKPPTVAGQLDATANPYAMSVKKDIKDQYMMGDFILVAPMFAGETSREVYLPQGKWYDFYTGELVGENQKINITPALDKIPLFVKDGGIIPMIPTRRQAPKVGDILPLEVRHYGSAAGSFQLYDDDGISFDYEKGAHSFTRLAVAKNSVGALQGELPTLPTGKPFGYAKEIKWVFMTKTK